MKIRDLNLNQYVVVKDLGAGKYSSGMRVIGRVVEIDDKGNYAIIESLPKHRYDITDFNDFELWSKQIEDKTERMSEDSIPKPGQNHYFNIKDFGPHNLYKINNQSNDVQQRKRNDTVNHPSHYNYGDIEVIDFIEQVTKHYNPNVAYHIGNAIKYLARSPHKNGKEDVAKAKWYIERAFENWDVK
ncbi:DUF3310 domain-containing protein [Staphylococcus saprophyticus]|uniref:DUF3310 domain-containing protein n=1 Tax=Staphylococcus saprophyticus TaxID=29385 RepID=UPI002DBF5898|nr:DUF3310 domain-containing protein [Staphylococcus saprophyticus]MEB8089540.1 DUF3310 domain-containing protein [Staphylococcus saprophyticus]